MCIVWVYGEQVCVYEYGCMSMGVRENRYMYVCSMYVWMYREQVYVCMVWVYEYGCMGNRCVCMSMGV